jgi:alpha-tubulin suppressor-like RCC1 family protein
LEQIVLGWGDNSMGQLGLGEQQKVQLPTILTWSSTKMMNVKQIGCGEATSFLVSELGECKCGTCFESCYVCDQKHSFYF